MRPQGLVVLALAAGALGAPGPPGDHSPSELIGTWRGTSTCADRVAAPACHDEVVVYDFTAAEKPGTVHWKADKVVDGKRAFMGEFDLAYDAAEMCWSAEVHGTRVGSLWCVTVVGDHLTGTGRELPGKQVIRKIEAKRD